MVTTNTLNKEALFTDWRIGRLLVEEFRLAQELSLASSVAWVVMHDHFHWLLELRGGDLSQLVQRVKSRSAIAINKVMLRSGPVWQPGFHDRAIKHEKDLQDLARYVVANPVRAGLVQRVGDYPLWDAPWFFD